MPTPSKKKLPESTARTFRAEYLAKIREKKTQPNGDNSVGLCIKALPMKRQERPLLLGEKLDETVQEVIRETCKTGGVSNTAIVVAAIKGILMEKNPSLL